MASHAGDRLGPYQIAGSLGAGGMGEVYRARDSRLDRDVAIKVLPANSAMPIEGGTPRVVGPGDSFAVDPDTGDLIVKLLERDAVRIARQPAADGPHTVIDTKGPYRLAPTDLLPGAVRGGRLAASLQFSTDDGGSR